MDWNRMRDDWDDQKARLRMEWSRLTSEDLDAITGRREVLLNMLEKRYKMPRDMVERQVADFEQRADGQWLSAQLDEEEPFTPPAGLAKGQQSAGRRRGEWQHR